MTVCKRGVTVPTTSSSATVHRGVAWRTTTEGRVLAKADVQALHASGDLPPPEDVLLVHVKPGEWRLDLDIPFTSKPAERRSYPFEAEPEKLDEDGRFSVAFVFVRGPETLSPGFSFPLVHVVDVTDASALGHVPTVDFSAAGAETTTITFGEVPAAPSEELLECVCIPGTTFEFDRSFIRPTVVDHLKKIDEVLGAHPATKLFVVGHTDRVGNDVYNKKLADRRAFSTLAFITDDAHAWELLYAEEGWGLKTVQVILADLGHDPGPPDGFMGPNTERAMRSFLGVPQGTPVANDPPFREELFLAYMTGKHAVKATADQFIAPRFTGCGEFNPLLPPNAAELANVAPGNEANRRVVVYLMSEAVAPPCAIDDVGPCRVEIAKPGPRTRFACAFYDELASRCDCEGGTADGPPPPAATGTASATVIVTLDGVPQDDATVRIDGPTKLPDARTTGGRARFEGLAAGAYVFNGARLTLHGQAARQLAAGQEVTLTIALTTAVVEEAPASLTVTVTWVGDGGERFPAATAVVVLSGRPGRAQAPATFTRLVPQEYVVTASDVAEGGMAVTRSEVVFCAPGSSQTVEIALRYPLTGDRKDPWTVEVTFPEEPTLYMNETLVWAGIETPLPILVNPDVQAKLAEADEHRAAVRAATMTRLRMAVADYQAEQRRQGNVVFHDQDQVDTFDWLKNEWTLEDEKDKEGATAAMHLTLVLQGHAVARGTQTIVSDMP